MDKVIFVGLAGLVGTLTRYWLSGVVARNAGETFPTGTLVVNLIGCFLIGVFFHLLQERFLVDPVVRTAILTGFLGGFTTFSSFGLQTFILLREGQVLLASLYVLLSNGLGIPLVWMGYVASKALTVKT